MQQIKPKLPREPAAFVGVGRDLDGQIRLVTTPEPNYAAASRFIAVTKAQFPTLTVTLEIQTRVHIAIRAVMMHIPMLIILGKNIAWKNGGSP